MILPSKSRDTDAGRKVGIAHRNGRGLVGNIEQIVLVDVDSARLAELVPHIQQLAILRKDLDGNTAPVRNIDAAFMIDGYVMDNAEMVVVLARPAPRENVLAVLVEADDAGVRAAVAVGQKDVACVDVKRDAIEAGEGLAFDRALDLPQQLAIGRKFGQPVSRGLAVSLTTILRATVADPNMAVNGIDVNAMGILELAPAEALHQVAIPVKLHDRVDGLVLAANGFVQAATVRDPDVDAVLINGDGAVVTPHPACGHLRPVKLGSKGIRQTFERRALGHIGFRVHGWVQA